MKADWIDAARWCLVFAFLCLALDMLILAFPKWGVSAKDRERAKLICLYGAFYWEGAAVLVLLLGQWWGRP